MARERLAVCTLGAGATGTGLPCVTSLAVDEALGKVVASADAVEAAVVEDVVRCGVFVLVDVVATVCGM